MMVFGNMSDSSGTGVAFTRDPATGEKKLMGEFLMNAHGEDVVAGVRTPMHIDQMKEIMPEVYDQFVNICNILETHYRDMQDMEFTIENRHLYMLQTRNGKRTAQAALKIACDLVDEGMRRAGSRLMIDPRNLTPCFIRSSTRRLLRKPKLSARVSARLPAPPAARSFSPPRMPRLGKSAAKRSFSSVLRPPRRISKA